MQVGILGPLVVEDAGQPVPIGGARLRSLLTRLAADPGRWVGSAALAHALWPDDDAPGDQANALQSLISRLRRALPDPQLIDSGPAGYRLVISDDDLDAARFERSIGRARRARAAGQIAGAAGELRTGLALWRGPALSDVPPLPYATAWATRLEELRLDATQERIDADLELGQLAGLVAELDGLVSAHPLREHLHGQLMRVLSRTGRQADALAAYERVRATLADELGVDPSPALRAVHLAVLQGAESAPEPVAVPRSPRTNLRPSLTSFVGRDDDIDAVTGALQRSRLVTLVGAGGAGKTRLSTEVAARLNDRMNGRPGGGGDGSGADGMWQVELAPVSDPDLLAAAALSAIGTLESTRMDSRQAGFQRDDLSRLAEAIGDRDVVLLLDNCEHVIDAAAKLAEQLLGQCPRLKVLATSREPLGITGESLWPVQPLATPAGGDALAELEKTAAVRLFVDRATLVRPGFSLDEHNAGAVSEICRRLDGLPLAIELAAARIRTVSPQSVADRLTDRFRLLTGGSRTAMPRHQTLRAVVAWSWDLLTDSERSLTERLSIFPGGATVEAAAAVAALGDQHASDPQDGDVLGQLIALADKSLLVPVDDDGPPRYRMLETIREFGTERLAERSEIQPVRAAFVAYFRGLAEAAEPRLRGPEQLGAMQQITDERENLLAAIRFAADAGDADSAVRLGASLAWYWTLLGRHDEAASMLGQALTVPGESSPESYLIALITYSINAAAVGQGMPDAAAIARMRELADQLDPLASHPLIAMIKPAIAVLADDRAGVIEAVESMLAHHDPWARAMLMLLDVVSAENEGDLARMRAILPGTLVGFRAVGDRWGTGTTLQTMANLRALDGDVAGSIAALEEGRVLMAELRATDDETYATIRIGILLLQIGELDAGRAQIEIGLASAEQAGTVHALAFAYLGRSTVALLSGDRATARSWGERAEQAVRGSALGPPQVLVMILALLAHLDLLEGDQESAVRRLTQAWGPALRSHDMPVTAAVMTTLAEVVSASGDSDLAARLIGAGEQCRGGPDRSNRDLLTLSAALRAKLGGERFDELVAQGRSLDRKGAIGLASEWLGIDPAEFTTPGYLIPGPEPAPS